MAQMQVFVSHSHEDDAFCRAIVAGLVGAGADVWYDEQNMGPGQLFDTIEQELRKRPVFILILSPAALRSNWVRDECKWAYMRLKRDPTRIIQPVLATALPDEDAIWMFMQDFKRIEATGLQPYPTNEAVRRLLHTLALTPAHEAPAPTGPQPSESAADLLERGKALIAQKRDAEALPLFERATQLNPSSFEAWVNLGYLLGKAARWSDSLSASDRALALDQNSTSAWNNKGNALSELKRFEEALAAYERALALDPAYAEAWNNKGAAFWDLKRQAEALSAFDHALALDPAYAEAWNNKGAALWDLKRYEEALEAYDRALALDPTLAAAVRNRAHLLRALGRTAEAEFDERRTKELGG